ncbi:MAG: tRNA pseudouridine(54/55) synthase Pus10 [Nitrososphaerota archaeon]|nr:tRNA pseudouridine(54/55) synthase Pus10 [Candidatus Bathyarchaeota archaeon]MDW8048720.1 tRNA pseudouridine(54/55) synthase Pus10 [Nitrososphaerota archaeon]
MGSARMDIIDVAEKMLAKYSLCNSCLGRQFAFLGHGMDNEDRGRMIKTILTMRAHMMVLEGEKRGISLLKILAVNGSFPMARETLQKLKRKITSESQTCFLCENNLQKLDSYVEKAARLLGDYEFDTLLVGIKLPPEVEEREDEFRARFGVKYGENLRNEFSRLLGKKICDTTGKIVDFANPHVVIIVNPFSGDVKIQVKSLYIMGRYRKLVRGIPQSRWICSECRGVGCQKCGGTGRIYQESVEELIGKPILDATHGSDFAFHGAGREDVDARMLGRGRPFIIQIKKPRKRSIDLSEIEKAINTSANGKIEVRNLKFVNRNMVKRIKTAESAPKTYKVIVKFDREITDEEIDKLSSSLSETIVHQQTPLRVIRRRSDKVREKKIYETRIKRISPNTILMRIRCQGGLYVKELVTGDNGRTRPSVSEIIGARAEPIDLDVMEVSYEG